MTDCVLRPGFCEKEYCAMAGQDACSFFVWEKKLMLAGHGIPAE